MKIAMLPGSFDPPTLGHINIIERSARLFDKLFVVVASNIAKKPLFTADERVELLKETLDVETIEVVSYSGLMAVFAKEHNVDVLIRGVRSQTDFNSEFEYAMNNRELNKDLEVLFIPTDHKYFLLHSSQVKELCAFGVDVSSMVPKNILPLLAERIEKREI